MLILLTDGSQTISSDQEEPADVASELRASGVKVLVVGIGRDVNRGDLEKISGSRDDTYIADNFDALVKDDFLLKLTYSTCYGAEQLFSANGEIQ